MGTSSVRAALFDARGLRVPGSLAQRSYSLKTDASGRAELDPKALLRQTKICLKEATAGQPDYAAVGVSCFWHSLLGTDAKGTPLTPIYTWADSRCAPDAERLRSELSEETVHRATGCMVRPSFWPAKLRWLQRTDRALFRKVKIWLSPAEWVQWQLTGESRCALGMATGTGLFDPSKLDWDAEILQACAFSADRMQVLGDEPTTWRGKAWYPAIGDGAASNLGSGADRVGLGAMNVGTSGALRIMKEGRVARAPLGLFAYRVDARRFLVGGAVSNAGNLHAWCLRELNLGTSPEELEKKLAIRPEPRHGLTVLPFWTAARAPSWDEKAQGVIVGLKQSTSAVDLLQAITEGFYYRLGLIAEMIGGHPQWIVAGGILQSPSALQRLANVVGEPLRANPEPEASLRGAAVFALEKLQIVLPELKYGAPVKPKAAIHRLYLQERARQAKVESASLQWRT